jgi:hypothetical protein
MILCEKGKHRSQQLRVNDLLCIMKTAEKRLYSNKNISLTYSKAQAQAHSHIHMNERVCFTCDVIADIYLTLARAQENAARQEREREGEEGGEREREINKRLECFAHTCCPSKARAHSLASYK